PSSICSQATDLVESSNFTLAPVEKVKRSIRARVFFTRSSVISFCRTTPETNASAATVIVLSATTILKLRSMRKCIQAGCGAKNTSCNVARVSMVVTMTKNDQRSYTLLCSMHMDAVHFDNTVFHLTHRGLLGRDSLKKRDPVLAQAPNFLPRVQFGTL